MADTTSVLVLGASGGLGTSTLSLAVGRRLADTGPPAVVVDLDLDGGGLEVTAGIEHLPGRRWDELRDVRGGVPPDLLLRSLPVEDGCHVLSARGGASPVPPEPAVLDVLHALVASEAQLVLDVPTSSPLLPAVLTPGALVVVLVALSTRGLADADAAVHRLVDAHDAEARDATRGRAGADRVDVRLVTRGGRAATPLLDDIAAHLGVGHLHHLADQRSVVQDAERGLFPGVRRDPVRRCADAVVAAVHGVAEAS